MEGNYTYKWITPVGANSFGVFPLKSFAISSQYFLMIRNFCTNHWNLFCLADYYYTLSIKASRWGIYSVRYISSTFSLDLPCGRALIHRMIGMNQREYSIYCLIWLQISAIQVFLSYLYKPIFVDCEISDNSCYWTVDGIAGFNHAMLGSERSR